MKRHRQLLAFLCILFLLIYISVAFFPHAHPHRDTECALCLLLQSSREILNALVLCAFLYLTAAKPILTNTHESMMPPREATLVGLKVKLSN